MDFRSRSDATDATPTLKNPFQRVLTPLIMVCSAPNRNATRRCTAVAISLREVEAVPDHEAVGDLEPDVADGNVDLAPLRLRQERAHLERRRLAGLETPHQVGQRQPRVDDVLDDEHVSARDVDVEILEDAHDARGVGGRAVARDRHEVDFARDRELAHEVGHEEHGSLEHADEEEIAARVVGGDLAPRARSRARARCASSSSTSATPSSTLTRASTPLTTPSHPGASTRPGTATTPSLDDDERPRVAFELAAPWRPRAHPAPSGGARESIARTAAADDEPGTARPTATTGPIAPLLRAAARRTRAPRACRRRGRPYACRPARTGDRRASAPAREAGGDARSRARAGSPRRAASTRRSSGRTSRRIRPAHGVVVRLVEADVESVYAAVLLGLVTPDVEQRTHDAVVAARTDAARRSAREQPVEHRLELVARRVSRWRAARTARSPRSVPPATRLRWSRRASRARPRRRADRRSGEHRRRRPCLAAHGGRARRSRRSRASRVHARGTWSRHRPRRGT